jgi:hypothetical protein
VQQVLVLVVVLDARAVDGDPSVGRANALHVLGEEVKSAPSVLAVCRAAYGLGEGVKGDAERGRRGSRTPQVEP